MGPALVLASLSGTRWARAPRLLDADITSQPSLKEIKYDDRLVHYSRPCVMRCESVVIHVGGINLISTAVPGATCRHDSGWALRADVVNARVWLGIHFRFADVAVRNLGAPPRGLDSRPLPAGPPPRHTASPHAPDRPSPRDHDRAARSPVRELVQAVSSAPSASRRAGHGPPATALMPASFRDCGGAAAAAVSCRPGREHFRRVAEPGIGLPATSLVTSQKALPADLRENSHTILTCCDPQEPGSGRENRV
jgi:hypothetical protein